LKSLMEGQFYRLRSSSLFFGDMIAYWRQLKRNKMCEPGINSEFATTSVTLEYVKSHDVDPEFQFVKKKTCFGDHATILKFYLADDKYKNGTSLEINQILSLFLECCTRRYLDQCKGESQEDIEIYLRRVKKRLLNPRLTIVEEMSDGILSEVERNVKYLTLRQKKEKIEAFDQMYLERFLNKIHGEQNKRCDTLMEIPMSTFSL
jgi:hypothetical protein